MEDGRKRRAQNGWKGEGKGDGRGRGDGQTQENIQGAERVITIPTHKTPNAV